MKNFILFLALLASAPSMAQFSVEGRVYSDSGCSYYYSMLADFKMSYDSSHLKPVESVDFVVGFHNTWGQKDWSGLRSVRAVKNSETSFVAQLDSVVVNERGNFAFDSIQWVAQITYQDKTQTWYRPGNTNSFFFAPFKMQASCQRGSFETLEVRSQSL